MKFSDFTKLIVVIFIFLGFFSVRIFSSTYYIATNGLDSYPGTSGQPFATFAHAFTIMNSGDILIVKDGNYQQTVRDIPSGTYDHYTIIKAEHDFKTTILGAGSDVLLVNSNYIRIEGLKFNGQQLQRNVGTITGSYVKILRCAFYGAYCEDNTVVVTTEPGCDYILFEDCWAWGCGRYKFVAYQSDHVIFRRCVSRFDYHHFDPNGYNDNQCATFTTYDTYHTLYQNCIGLDSGNDWELYGNVVGAVWCENNDNIKNYIKIKGSIFLNIKGFGAFNDPKVRDAHIFQNIIAWDCQGGGAFENYNGGGSPSYSVEHATIGNIWGLNQDASRAWGAGFYSLDVFNAATSNSIFYKCHDYGLGGKITSNYNCFFQNGQNYLAPAAAGVHDKTVDPQLKYLCRVEENSPLKRSASDGGDIGATVLKRYGVSGTLWNEPGYDSLTNENLWPFPNENEIKTDMSSRSGPNNGKRGFCANGNGIYGGPITLTSYIWEYLGNPCPLEFYSSTGIENFSNSGNPDVFSLSQNYPNPFSQSTAILFKVSVPGKVDIKVIDISGRLVTTLVNEDKTIGTYTVHWDGTNSTGQNVNNGVYFCQLYYKNELKSTIKMVLAKNNN